MACSAECGSAKFCANCGAPLQDLVGAAEVKKRPLVGRGVKIFAVIILGGLGLLILAAALDSNSSPSRSGNAVSTATAETASPTTPDPQPAKPAESTPQVYRIVIAGAPLCSSFKGAITAAAVMQSGNPMVIDAVLSRQGCQTSSQQIALDPGDSVQELEAGVVVINTPAGDRVYTTGVSLSTTSSQ